MATQQVQVNQRDQATRMSDMDIMEREKTWSGTSPTGNSSFDKNFI